MVAPAKLINPQAGGGWEEIRVKGAARIGDLAVWARNGSVTSVLGAIALLGDLTSHAVQAGFNQAPAMHSMVFATKNRNVIGDDESVAGFSVKLNTSGIPAGSTIYLLDYTENTYLFTGTTGDVQADGSIDFIIPAGFMNLFQYGPHSCIGIIDPPGAAKPLIFDFWYARVQTGTPIPTTFTYDGTINYDGVHAYGDH